MSDASLIASWLWEVDLQLVLLFIVDGFYTKIVIVMTLASALQMCALGASS